MKYLMTLLIAVCIGCDEQPTEWTQTLAISSDGRTTWRAVIIADVTDHSPQVLTIPDYATEVLLIKSGAGFVTAHSSPDNRDHVLTGEHDTLRITIR